MVYIYRFFLTIFWVLFCSGIGVFFRYKFGTSVLGALPAVLLFLPCAHVTRLIWAGRFDIRKKGPTVKNCFYASSCRPQTFVKCPSCGEMVPKGQPSCTCGYDLTTPTKRFFKKFSRIILPLFLCCCFAVGGYFLGRYSMQPEVDASYQAGYDEGYDKGHVSGYNRGVLSGYNAAESISDPEEMVYISDNDNRYHESKSCYYLKLFSDVVEVNKVAAVLHGKVSCTFCNKGKLVPIK